jgi:hypothetical protein
VRDRYGLSPQQLHMQIRSMFKEATDALSASNVAYQDLKSALVPSTEKNAASALCRSTSVPRHISRVAKKNPLLTPPSRLERRRQGGDQKRKVSG